MLVLIPQVNYTLNVFFLFMCVSVYVSLPHGGMGWS